MFPSPTVFAEIYRRHGHRCPMSTLGGRLGHAARRRLGEGEGLRAVYRARTCAVDGIALTTGCSPEAGSLAVEDCGRHVLTVTRPGGDGVTVALRAAALELAGSYRRLRDAAAEEARLERVLEELRTLPEDRLLTVRLLPGSRGDDA